MKYPLNEALRHNGKTYRPPGSVELDPKEDAEDIARLTRKGVIGKPGTGTDADDDAKAQADADAKAEEEAKAQAQADAETKAEQEAKAQQAKPAAKTTKAKE